MVLYNFQLHHVFHNLESAIQSATGGVAGDGHIVPEDDTTAMRPALSSTATRSPAEATRPGTEEEGLWLPPRLTTDLKDVKIVHFSGQFKFWHRDYETSPESDEAFVERFLTENSPWPAHLWIERNGNNKDYRPYGLRRGRDSLEPLDSAAVSPDAIDSLINKALEQIRGAARRAAKHWREDMEQLTKGVLQDVESVADLFQKLRGPQEHPTEEQPRGPTRVDDCLECNAADVEVHWWHTDTWYPAKLLGGPCPPGQVSVQFGAETGWGGQFFFNESSVRPLDLLAR